MMDFGNPAAWWGWLCLLVVLFGLVSCLLPILPGAVIIWAGVVLHKLVVPEVYPWWIVIAVTVLMVLVQLLDIACGYLGARHFGSTWKGAVGAVIGGLLGPFALAPLLTPLGGLLVGPPLGAVIGELSAGRTVAESQKAGWGTVIGGLVSVALKMGFGVLMACLYAYGLWA